MKRMIDALMRMLNQEAWTAFYRKRRKNPLNTRDFMWRAIRLYVARAAMPSWGLPFEAIAASALLKDRRKKKQDKKEEAQETPA